jgi:pimeloyl-ACP methyl ester carboxylesterase
MRLTPSATKLIRTSDGVRLYVAEYGTGPLTVVLLHGWTLDHRLWRSQIADLPDAIGRPVRILAVDLRGHGRSSAPSRRAATLERLADDVADVLRQRAPDGPVVLIGHSLGGMAILEYAHRHPDEFATRVAGVALLSTTAEGHAHTTYGLPSGVAQLVRRLEIGGSALLALAGPWRFHRAVMPALSPALRWLVFGDHANAAAIRLTASMVGRTSLRCIGGFRPAIAAMDRVAALQALREMPVVVMVGGRDRLTPLACTETISNALPDARRLVLPECGHLLPLECPNEVTDALAAVCHEALERGQSSMITTPVSSLTKSAPSAVAGVCAPGGIGPAGPRRAAR